MTGGNQSIVVILRERKRPKDPFATISDNWILLPTSRDQNDTQGVEMTFRQGQSFLYRGYMYIEEKVLQIEYLSCLEHRQANDILQLNHCVVHIL